MNSFKVYLALQGTPFEFTKGASAKAAYRYSAPLALKLPLVVKIFIPFERKSAPVKDTSASSKLA